LSGMGVELLCLEDLAAALSVPVARLKAWEPILEFAYYSRESQLAPPKINPNTASIEQLTTLPLLKAEKNRDYLRILWILKGVYP
jgi:DNA uptake protein ComE-like DNA-binding protein